MEIFVQLGDFFLKAAVAYVQTPAGKKELDDIEQAVGDVIGDMLPFDVADSSPKDESTPTAKDSNRFTKRTVRS